MQRKSMCLDSRRHNRLAPWRGVLAGSGRPHVQYAPIGMAGMGNRQRQAVTATESHRDSGSAIRANQRVTAGISVPKAPASADASQSHMIRAGRPASGVVGRQFTPLPATVSGCDKCAPSSHDQRSATGDTGNTRAVQCVVPRDVCVTQAADARNGVTGHVPEICRALHRAVELDRRHCVLGPTQLATWWSNSGAAITLPRGLAPKRQPRTSRLLGHDPASARAEVDINKSQPLCQACT